MSRRLGAEFLGTFWLVFGGAGSAIFAAALPEVGIGLLGVSLAFGLTVVTMAYAVGHISGGHFNPAVTIGLWAGGRFPIADVIPYWVSQVLGAIAAAATTPADVLKTRAMTGQTAAGEAMWVTMQNIVKKEGVPALFKGVIPRMLWIAPLGAMNFAGYELAKRAMQAAEADVDGNAQSESKTVPPPAKEITDVTVFPDAGEEGSVQSAGAVVAELPTTSDAEISEEQTSSDATAPVDVGQDPSASVGSRHLRSLSSASAEVEANTKPPGSE